MTDSDVGSDAEEISPIIDCDVLEAAKENIQPLAKGRRATALSAILATPHAQRENRLAATRQRLRMNVDMALEDSVLSDDEDEEDEDGQDGREEDRGGVCVCVVRVRDGGRGDHGYCDADRSSHRDGRGRQCSCHYCLGVCDAGQQEEELSGVRGE